MGLLIFWGIVFVIVLLHELGHLLMAKKYGVGVNIYSIGFGPILIGVKFYRGKASFKIGNMKPTNKVIWNMLDNTEYRIAPIPFGGYCALSGEMENTGKPDELASKALNQKIQIVLAGVGLNFITGIFVLLGVSIKHHGLVAGLKTGILFIYQIIITLFLGIYYLCSGQLGMTTAKDTNTVMTGLNLEFILIYFGLLSILIGLFNLVPFPAMDGSYPFYWLIEKISKGKATKVLKIVWFIGFIVLMALQFIILYFWVFGK